MCECCACRGDSDCWLTPCQEQGVGVPLLRGLTLLLRCCKILQMFGLISKKRFFPAPCFVFSVNKRYRIFVIIHSTKRPSRRKQKRVIKIAFRGGTWMRH